MAPKQYNLETKRIANWRTYLRVEIHEQDEVQKVHETRSINRERDGLEVGQAISEIIHK